MLARLPLLTGAAVLAGAAALFFAAWEPAIGLGLAVLLGPARAYLAIAAPDVPDPGQLFFGLAAAGWLARGLLRRDLRLPRSPLLGLLAIYLGVGLVSQLNGTALEEGLKELIKWAEIALGLVIGADEARRGRARGLVAALVLAGLAQGGLAVYQSQLRGTGPEHFRLGDGSYRAYGSFEQPNPLGGFLGLLWPVAAGLAWAALEPLVWARWGQVRAQVRAWLRLDWERTPPPARPPAWRRYALGVSLGGAALVMLGGLFFSYSRGAWLGAAAAGVALVAALPRRWWAGLALVTAGGALALGLRQAGLLPAGIANRLADVADFTSVTDVRGVNINDANFAIVERLAHWQAAEGMARDYPWLGVGLGNYGAAYPRYALLNWPNALGHAHMIYLNVLAETGVVGLAAYVLLWGLVFAQTLRLIGRSRGWERGLALGLLGAWVHLSAHQVVDNLYVNNIHFTLAVLLGLLAAPAAFGPTPDRKETVTACLV
ncbi:MAG: O-antigen ligase family protein [Anaerolineales bacterium]|nr:O-antigen ligase family protein [Anaerolineales bacterium]